MLSRCPITHTHHGVRAHLGFQPFEPDGDAFQIGHRGRVHSCGGQSLPGCPGEQRSTAPGRRLVERGGRSPYTPLSLLLSVTTALSDVHALQLYPGWAAAQVLCGEIPDRRPCQRWPALLAAVDGAIPLRLRWRTTVRSVGSASTRHKYDVTPHRPV